MTKVVEGEGAGSARGKGTGEGTAEKGAESPTDSVLAAVEKLEVGMVIVVKGTLAPYTRPGPGPSTTNHKTQVSDPQGSILQLHLLRLAPLPTTASELLHISSRSAYHSTTLSQPWALSQSQQQALLQETLDEEKRVDRQVRHERERAKRHHERERRHERELAARWEEEEKMREAEGMRVRGEADEVMVFMKERRRRKGRGKDDSDEPDLGGRRGRKKL